MNTAISYLLRGGVLLSIGVVVIGLVFTFVHHPQYVTSKAELGTLTSPDAVYPHTVHDVVAQAAGQHGQAIVMLGLLLLIATPIARVAFSVAAFIVERDRVYVVITIIVLVLLVLSLLFGGSEGAGANAAAMMRSTV
jgi:uncharacterized membrane protein